MARSLPAPTPGPLPTYIDRTRLRATLTATLNRLEATVAALVACRYRRPTVLLRGTTTVDGTPAIQVLPVEFDAGQAILRRARRSA